MKRFFMRTGRYITVAVPLLVSVAGEAFAQQAPTVVIGPSYVSSSLCSILGWFFFAFITLSIVMVLWAAMLYATAQDNAEQVQKARQTLTYAAVGVVVALLAKGFPGTIGKLLNLDVGSGGCQ